MKVWDIGVSVCGTRDVITKELFEGYRDAGVSCMEICLRHIGKYENPDIKTTAITSHNAKELVRAAKETGVAIWSLHLPFGEGHYDISSTNQDMRQYAIQKFSELIRYAAELETGIAVLHPSSEPIEKHERKERLKLSADALYTLAKTARECGVTIAVENLPRTCLGRESDEILQLISADDSLRVCFDVNHLLMQSHKNFMSAVGDVIITVHMSDYDFIDERHWLPGMGKIDWEELIGLLKKAGYQGPFMNEVPGRLENEVNDRCTVAEICHNSKRLLELYF